MELLGVTDKITPCRRDQRVATRTVRKKKGSVKVPLEASHALVHILNLAADYDQTEDLLLFLSFERPKVKGSSMDRIDAFLKEVGLSHKWAIEAWNFNCFMDIPLYIFFPFIEKDALVWKECPPPALLFNIFEAARSEDHPCFPERFRRCRLCKKFFIFEDQREVFCSDDCLNRYETERGRKGEWRRRKKISRARRESAAQYAASLRFFNDFLRETCKEPSPEDMLVGGFRQRDALRKQMANGMAVEGLFSTLSDVERVRFDLGGMLKHWPAGINRMFRGLRDARSSANDLRTRYARGGETIVDLLDALPVDVRSRIRHRGAR